MTEAEDGEAVESAIPTPGAALADDNTEAATTPGNPEPVSLATGDLSSNIPQRKFPFNHAKR